MRMLRLPRTLSYHPLHPTEGRDVLAIQRTLAQRGIYKRGKPSGHYGTQTRDAVKEFQRRNGLKQDGVYGPTTHAKLATLMDGYSKWLMQNTVVHRDTKREKIIKAAHYAYLNRGNIHYSQIRPMSDMAPPPNVPNYMDCSYFATWCYKVAGANDPNGFGYNGYGYTGTLMVHGTRTYSPKPGDLVFYSYPDHVAIYAGSGSVYSHGSEPGPYYLAMGYRRVSQIRTYTL